ncbi:trans-1,2-dihydrobenzene-1,2-diol dehydrogenase [Pimephales promelas]|nr:trans-1,2-dihydrobenzene-1,2-diol dehydrogenase [Pimephales promelas]
MGAVWTRFFPASAEIRRLLSRDELGEVKLVRADFGASLMHVSRAVEKDLGGGALIDIGIYCLQFVLMVFNGEKPERTRSHPRSCLKESSCMSLADSALLMEIMDEARRQVGVVYSQDSQ